MFRKQVSLPKSFFGGHHLRVQEVLGKDEQIHIYKVNVLTCNCRGQLKTMPFKWRRCTFLWLFDRKPLHKENSGLQWEIVQLITTILYNLLTGKVYEHFACHEE